MWIIQTVMCVNIWWWWSTIIILILYIMNPSHVCVCVCCCFPCQQCTNHPFSFGIIWRTLRPSLHWSSAATESDSDREWIPKPLTSSTQHLLLILGWCFWSVIQIKRVFEPNEAFQKWKRKKRQLNVRVGKSSPVAQRYSDIVWGEAAVITIRADAVYYHYKKKKPNMCFVLKVATPHTNTHHFHMIEMTPIWWSTSSVYFCVVQQPNH